MSLGTSSLRCPVSCRFLYIVHSLGYTSDLALADTSMLLTSSSWWLRCDFSVSHSSTELSWTTTSKNNYAVFSFFFVITSIYFSVSCRLWCKRRVFVHDDVWQKFLIEFLVHCTFSRVNLRSGGDWCLIATWQNNWGGRRPVRKILCAIKHVGDISESHFCKRSAGYWLRLDCRLG
jgi:hypothetical protein